MKWNECGDELHREEDAPVLVQHNYFQIIFSPFVLNQHIFHHLNLFAENSQAVRHREGSEGLSTVLALQKIKTHSSV